MFQNSHFHMVNHERQQMNQFQTWETVAITNIYFTISVSISVLLVRPTVWNKIDTNLSQWRSSGARGNKRAHAFPQLYCERGHGQGLQIQCSF